MYTRCFDAALDAIASCKRRLPELGELYPVDTPQRRAIDRALAAVEEARQAVFKARPGER